MSAVVNGQNVGSLQPCITVTEQVVHLHADYLGLGQSATRIKTAA